MAGRTKLKNSIREKISLAVVPPKYVGYLDCVLRTPITFRVTNGCEEELALRLVLQDGKGLFIPYENRFSAPFEKTVEVSAEGILSPLFLADLEEPTPVTAEAILLSEGGEVGRAQAEIVCLPFDYWEGLSGNAERLACFVRPRLAECSRTLEDAGKRLKKWSETAEIYGYAGADKNTIRLTLAALFASVKAKDPEREEGALSSPVRAFSPVFPKERKTTPLALALHVAACLEQAQLDPVIAVGKGGVGVGTWLYESCFPDPVTDDCETVEKFISDGINNLAFFDAEDLFSARNLSFTLSGKHFAEKLKEGYFEYFIDIRRCRIAGMPVLPLKEKGLHGAELVGEAEMSFDSAPAPLPALHKPEAEKQTRNKIWERRLLDLSARNTLLVFAGKNALHLRAGDPDALLRGLLDGEEYKLSDAPTQPLFGVKMSSAQRELCELERKSGLVRAYAQGEELSETARLLQRKNREADEESGAKLLYLAFGFLRYVSKEDGAPRYAPLVLLPVDLVRAKGNEDFSLRAAEREYFVNATLLELLKQEFNIDILGLGGDVSALKATEICAMVLAEVAGMKGWTVINEVYLAAFSFRRYLMWRDLHAHFDDLKSNALFKALLKGRAERAPLPAFKEEDEGDPAGTLTPLPADSSQYAAIALSRTGASFVLHGPPGTGKSQTITNIIANALEDGKRVLFIAEKKAALDVVKKRLDAIGIGEFCLELHSDKADKNSCVKRLEDTAALAGGEHTGDFNRCAEEIGSLRGELLRPMRALHKKRRLGISVYQAILLYLKNKDAPDVMDIESGFYDTLSERKLADCKMRILSAAAAAKECGGVFRSPFENVNLTEYSSDLRDKLYCASEVLLAEIRHLRAFLGLFLEFYRQKISTLTPKKLENLCTVIKNLNSGLYSAYFSGVTEEQFTAFFNANRRLDELLVFYNRHFRVFVEPDQCGEIRRALENGDIRTSKAAVSAAKKLSRAALHPLTGEDTAKFLQVVVDICSCMEQISAVPLAANFLDRSGRVVFRRRAEYLTPLYRLHDLCRETFLDFRPDAFNGMCIRAQSGYTAPVLEGFLRAAEAFSQARTEFLAVTNAKRERFAQEDVLDDYSAKASALIDNIDLLANWCMYRKTGERLKELGCSFVTDALESGKLTGENVLAGFEKNVYKNFLEINLPSDPELSRLTAGTLEDTVEKFRAATEEFTRLTREKIRLDLISRLPEPDGEGSLAVETAALKRLSKSNLRGMGLRGLFAEIPELLGRLAPCLLMSPSTAAQYLQPQADLYDLVIFDEASQMTTAEAVGCIARAKSAIVVGDPRQLPPTSFFRADHVDEDNLENEDLESILDDCLALGMPERHLLWHYRSKHESLIAFSNGMYYDNMLCTFPSPDSLKSRVRLVQVEGSYDRGFTKRNKREAEALVGEVVRRLKDPVLSRSSIGVVTFSGAQQSFVERLLSQELAKQKLESVAYDRDEPLFVKNLENVQGDERDVVLFSVCYGPDPSGRISLNFGPLNQAGGWRRLNVAVSRAREEMIVFSTMTAGMIDLSKTSSKGVAGLKAFLDYAERGKLPVRSGAVKEGVGIGRYLAAELKGYGYDCRVDVGASDFKIDVAVVDPADPQEFLLAILFDGTDKFSVKDRNVLQIQTLKRANWNVARVNCVNYYNNPKREVKRIKDMLDKLTGAEKKSGASLARYARVYRAVKTEGAEISAFVTCGENDGAIAARLKEIVAAEEPISRNFLKTRCLATFGILKSGARVLAKLDFLIDGCKFRMERVGGTEYFYKNDRALRIGRFRTDESGLRRAAEDFTPFETVSLIKALLEERVSVYLDELGLLVCSLYKVRPSERFNGFIRECVAFGEQKGILVRSVSDRISLA